MQVSQSDICDACSSYVAGYFFVVDSWSKSPQAFVILIVKTHSSLIIADVRVSKVLSMSWVLPSFIRGIVRSPDPEKCVIPSACVLRQVFSCASLCFPSCVMSYQKPCTAILPCEYSSVHGLTFPVPPDSTHITWSTFWKEKCKWQAKIPRSKCFSVYGDTDS